MQIKQWEDKNLAHFSYAVWSDGAKKMVLIDPARNPEPYLAYAKEHKAEIIGIIETHPHADFISSHLELQKRTGATVYCSRKLNAFYPYQPFDEGDSLVFGDIKLSPLNTPGHSPDSICIVLEHDGVKKAVFTGDTLFVGDCGRPDLREGAGDIKMSRNELAGLMYHSLRDKLMPLPDACTVYPAHGAGTLCGKALSEAPSSTIGAEKRTNWSLQPMSEQEFVRQLLHDQPFIPAYFPYGVELNRQGAPDFAASIATEPISAPVDSIAAAARLQKELWIIDARDEKIFKKGHLPHAINLMEGTKFDTWLGSIIKPGESFYLAGTDKEQLDRLIARAAAIGYEKQIREAFVLALETGSDEKLDLDAFKQHPEAYTIVDVRNPSEVADKKLFPNSIPIPLAELRERTGEIPTQKPIVVHCAGGYRSAAASSLLGAKLKGQATVLDLGEAVKEFI